MLIYAELAFWQGPLKKLIGLISISKEREIMERPVYVVNSCFSVTEDGREYTSYGIACVLNNEVLKKIDDISSNCEFVSNVAHCFTMCGLNIQRFQTALEILISLGSDMLEELGMYDAIS